MGVPTKYPSIGQAIASYDWNDLASGTGFQTYYGFTTTAVYPSVYTYHLNKNAFYSNSVETTAAGPSNGIKIDKDFDLHFNLPQIIEGDLWAEISIAMADTATTRVYAQIFVRKWDGTPGAGETEIANAESERLKGDVLRQKTINVKVAVPNTSFKAGEYLRITVHIIIEAYAGTGDVGFAHDPKDRAGTMINKVTGDATTTIFKVAVPFVPDLGV